MAHADQLGLFRPAGEQLLRGDQPGAGGFRPAGQHRGNGQEELIQHVVGDEPAEELRAALGEYSGTPGRPEAGEQLRGPQRRLLSQVDDRAPGWKPPFQSLGAGCRGQDQRAVAQRRVPGGHLAAGGDDRKLGVARAAQAAAQSSVSICSRRADMPRGPLVAWRGPQGACADQHYVRTRPEQAHDEPVRRVVAADRRPGGWVLWAEGGHSVEGRDEVGIHARLREPEIPAVGICQFLR